MSWRISTIDGYHYPISEGLPEAATDPRKVGGDSDLYLYDMEDDRTPFGLLYGDQIKRDQLTDETVEKNVKRAQLAGAAPDLLEALKDSTEALERVGCQFFACDGPDVPPVHMKTCHVCEQIRENRRIIDLAEGRATKHQQHPTPA